MLLETGYVDIKCVELFVEGADIVGELATSGTCEPEEHEPSRKDSASNLHKVKAAAKSRNLALISKLRTESHHEEIFKEIEEEVKLGRMDRPKKVKEIELEKVILTRRFGIEQGQRADGTPKIRAIDDASESLINSCCKPTEKLSCDNIDELTVISKEMTKNGEDALEFWKADIKAAFRRILLKQNQRSMMVSTFATIETVWTIQHNVMPFGPVGSVHAWHRLGQALWHIITKMLDEYFGVERRGLAEHTARCVKEVIDALMGTWTAAEEKVLWGNPLTILGIKIKHEQDCLVACLDEEKANKWSKQLESIVQGGRCSAKEAEKMAGRFAFASKWTFRRLGRAISKPFYIQGALPLPKGIA